MSILGKKPYLYEVFETLSEGQLTTLQGLVDNPGNATLVDFYNKGISNDLLGVNYVTVQLDRFTKVYGFLCYTNTKCGLFTWQNDSTRMDGIELKLSNRTFQYHYEELDAEEFRRAIDDFLEAKAGGEVTPAKLASLMEGNNLVSVDLNEAETKVVAELDMTGASEGDVICAGASGESAEWKTIEEALQYPTDYENKFLGTSNTGIMWKSIDLSGKENKGKITIGETEYTVALSTTDEGQAGYITFVIEQ